MTLTCDLTWSNPTLIYSKNELHTQHKTQIMGKRLNPIKAFYTGTHNLCLDH